jgi:succinate dehydrogenase/fumarate reductase-like Fe-S protein
VVLHYARFLWPWRKRFGLERFKQNYIPEGLPAASPASRDMGHEPGRCTVCGACDSACPLVLKLPRAEFLGPMRMVTSATRAAPHFEDASTTLRTMAGPACEGCRLCDEACPEDIPLVDLARLLVEQLDVIERAKSGAEPSTFPPEVGG